VVIGAGNRLLSDGTFDYTYDAAGNMLSETPIDSTYGGDEIESETMSFTYDADNRLTSVVASNSGLNGGVVSTVNYTYDLYGNLIGNTSTVYYYWYYGIGIWCPDIGSNGDLGVSTTQQFVYDPATGDAMLSFDGSGNLTSRFLWGPIVDEILAQEQESPGNPQGAATDWMTGDYQGSVVDMLSQNCLDSGVDSQNHLVYSVWGQIQPNGPGQSPPVTPVFGHDGEYTDPVTGMEWHIDRWYLPWAQRWATEDPTGLLFDSNPYRYCGNNPVNGTDPSGLSVETLQSSTQTQYTVYASQWDGWFSWRNVELGTVTVQDSEDEATKARALQLAQERDGLGAAFGDVSVTNAMLATNQSGESVAAALVSGAADGGAVTLNTLTLGNVAHERAELAQERAAKYNLTLSQVGFGAGKIGARSLQAAAVIATGGAVASAASGVAASSATGAAVVGTVGTAAQAAAPALIVAGAGATIQNIQAARANFQNGNVAAATDSLGNAFFTGALTVSPFASDGGAAAAENTLPSVEFSASQYPELAANIRNAQLAGHPEVLTYGGDAAANRAAALEGVPNISPLSRDEYPFASTMEGGEGAWVGHVPASQQNAQGGILRYFYETNNIQPGDQFRVTVGE
jgi:RHS repeat-associated protein